MEYKGDDSHSCQVSNGDSCGDDSSCHQVDAADDQRQGGQLTDGAGAITQEHIQNALLGQGRHDHMVQRSRAGNSIHTDCGIAGQRCREQHQHKCTGEKSGVEDVLTQAAAQKLGNNDGQRSAHSSDPVRNGAGQGHGKEHAGDQSGSINDGIAALGKQAIQVLCHHSRSHGDQGHQQRPEAQDYSTYDQSRNQRQYHIQHQPAGAEVSTNMRRRSDYQIHFFSSFAFFSAIAALSIPLPLRNCSTKGSLPGQVNAQQPHSMQSSRWSRWSSSVLPHME